MTPYSAAPGHYGGYYVDGPDSYGQFSYYGEKFSFPEKEDCAKAADMANLAYQEGFKAARADMRKALGFVKEQA